MENPKFLKFMTTHPPTVVNTKTIQAKQAAAKKAADAVGEGGDAKDGEKKEDGTAKPAAAEPRPKTAKPKARVGTPALIASPLIGCFLLPSALAVSDPLAQTTSTTTTGR